MTYQESIPKGKIIIIKNLNPKEFTYTNSCNEHSLKFKWAEYEEVQKTMSF